MTCKIFGRGTLTRHVIESETSWLKLCYYCTYWHTAFKDLQPDVGPLADGLKVDASVDERLREVSPSRPQRVRSYRDGAGHLVRVKEFGRLETDFD
jgi:hypothetical protein